MSIQQTAKISHTFVPVGSVNAAMPMKEIESRMASLSNSLDRLRDSIITLKQNLHQVLTPECMVDGEESTKDSRSAESPHGQSILAAEREVDNLDHHIQEILYRIAL